MNILFSIYLNSTEKAKIYSVVLELLTDLGHKVVVLCKKNRYVELITKEHEIQDRIVDLKQNDFNLILTSVNSNIKELKNMSHQAGIPIISLIDFGEYAIEEIARHNDFDKIVLLNPPLDYPKVFMQSNFFNHWRLPSILHSTNTNTNYQLRDPMRPRILFGIEERIGLSSPIFQLIPFLNRLLNFKITLATKNTGIQKMLNSNVRIVSKRETDLQQFLTESDIVVASGSLAEQAIAFNKPVIIAGERGYGGLLSEDIFEPQYQNQFQGRIGGSLGEYIPGELLIEKIFDLLEWGNDRVNTITQTNWQLLKEKDAEQEIALNKFLLEMVIQHKNLRNKLAEVRLKLSAAWQIKQFSEGKFALLNIATGQINSHFEKEEVDILGLFREGSQVKMALEASGHSAEPELFVDFIKNLIDEKILVIDGNS